MPRLLVFQHVPFEILGTLNPLLKEHGFRIRYVNFGRQPDAQPSLDGYQGLVVLGGPMNVGDEDRHPHLATECRAIEEAIRRDIPVLGICLGAQLIAAALGARVMPSPEKEIGWYDVDLTEAGREDKVLGAFGGERRVFQWHGYTYDLPGGAVQLARSTGCEQQAFRYGERVYGLQFHLEVDQPLIERWLRVPVHLEELRALGRKVDPTAIRRETRDRIDDVRRLSDATFTRFIELFGTTTRRPRAPHH